MANLFKPEVNIVGGTNVSVNAPPVMDYSGIFSTVGSLVADYAKSQEAPKLSETEKKNEFLFPYLKRQKEIYESDLPDVKKNVLVKELEMKVATEGGAAYLDTFKAASSSVSAYYDPAGDPVAKMIEDQNKWASESTIGQTARINALGKAMDKEGNVDESIYMTELSAAYNEDKANQAKLDAMSRAVQTNKVTQEFNFTTEFGPMAEGIVQKDIESFVSKPVVNGILNKLKTDQRLIGAEAGIALELANLISQQQMSMKAELQRMQLRGGMNPNESTFSVDPILTPYEDLKTALTNASTSVEKAIQTSENSTNAILMQKAPPILKVYKATGASPQIIMDQMAQGMLDVKGGGTEQIQKWVEAFSVPTYNLNGSITGSGTNTIGTIPDQAANGTSETTRLLPEWDKEFITNAAAYTPEQQTASIEKANISFKTYTSGTITDANHASMRAKEISDAYAVLATRVQGNVNTGVTPVDQTKILFGPSAFTMISDIDKKDPTSGEALYNQVNKTIQTETIRNTAYIGAILSSNFPNNPFSLVVNNKGNLEIKVNPEARKNDPYLLAAVAPAGEGLSMKDKKIPDNMPDQEIFEKAMGMYNKLPLVGKTAEVKKAIESLNYLLKATDRLPDRLKNSPDFAGIHLREIISSPIIPPYQGMSVAVPE